MPYVPYTPVDIILIASGAAFGCVVLVFIAVSVCIFLYCLTRNKKRAIARTRDGGIVGLQTTPTESDATTATSIEFGPGSSSSVRETSFNNATSMYPKFTEEKQEELDSKEPPPAYDDCAAAPPAAHVPPENHKYQVSTNTPPLSLGVYMLLVGCSVYLPRNTSCIFKV